MSGYTGKPTSHTSVAETTFFLCKPGLQHLHRHLLQLVADANFRVQAKTLTLPPAMAECIAKTFPSVKQEAAAATPSTTTTRAVAPISPSSHLRDADASPKPSALEAHIRYLCSGPCLAMALSSTNAVNRLLAMVGPEDPTDARQVAPTSLRALHGGCDVLHNAVHASTNLSDAGLCIRTVFGYDTPSLTAGAGSSAAVVVAAATAGREGDGLLPVAEDDTRATDELDTLFTLPRPDPSALRLSTAGPDPLTLADLLQRAPEDLHLLHGARLAASPSTPSCRTISPASSVMAQPLALDTEAWPGRRLGTQFLGFSYRGGDSSSTAADASRHDGTTDGASALSRQQLAEAWENLARQQELLRLKEMDMFLREAAMRANQTAEANAAASPSSPLP